MVLWLAAATRPCQRQVFVQFKLGKVIRKIEMAVVILTRLIRYFADQGIALMVLIAGAEVGQYQCWQLCRFGKRCHQSGRAVLRRRPHPV